MKFDLDRWRDLLGQVEVLRTYYDRLNDRERIIVLGSGAGGIAVLMFLIYLFFAAASVRVSYKIDRSRADLKQIENLATVYRDMERQIREMENVIRRTPTDFQLATHLENLANRYGVKIESLKNRPGPPNDLYLENQVAVSVKQIPLRVLISFLFDIENSQELLRVTSLEIKPTFTDPSMLNATFVVSTFQMKEGL